MTLSLLIRPILSGHVSDPLVITSKTLCILNMNNVTCYFIIYVPFRVFHNLEMFNDVLHVMNNCACHLVERVHGKTIPILPRRTIPKMIELSYQ